MKLTPNEQKICDRYSGSKNGKCECPKCLLVINAKYYMCYKNIDGTLEEVKHLKRYRQQ